MPRMLKAGAAVTGARPALSRPLEPDGAAAALRAVPHMPSHLITAFQASVCGPGLELTKVAQAEAPLGRRPAPNKLRI